MHWLFWFMSLAAAQPFPPVEISRKNVWCADSWRLKGCNLFDLLKSLKKTQNDSIGFFFFIIIFFYFKRHSRTPCFYPTAFVPRHFAKQRFTWNDVGPTELNECSRGGSKRQTFGPNGTEKTYLVSLATSGKISHGHLPLLISCRSARHVSISVSERSSALALRSRFGAKVLSRDGQRIAIGPLRKPINLDLLCLMIRLDSARRSLWKESVCRINKAKLAIEPAGWLLQISLLGLIGELYCPTFAGSSWARSRKKHGRSPVEKENKRRKNPHKRQQTDTGRPAESS